MGKTKQQWIEQYRKEAERNMPTALKQKDVNKKSEVINKAIKSFTSQVMVQIKIEAKRSGWSNEDLLNEILMATYASYIVMLEYRNKVWPYEYMAFARRIGELWEPFCKIPFEYPVKPLKLIDAPDFNKVQAGMQKKQMII